MLVNIVRQIRFFLNKWFWKKPTEEVPQETVKLKAKEVLHAYACVKYKDQWINLRKSELVAWNNLSRKDRRAMAHKTAMQVKKGEIVFIEVDGKMTCVKNRDYQSRTNGTEKRKNRK